MSSVVSRNLVPRSDALRAEHRHGEEADMTWEIVLVVALALVFLVRLVRLVRG